MVDTPVDEFALFRAQVVRILNVAADKLVELGNKKLDDPMLRLEYINYAGQIRSTARDVKDMKHEDILSHPSELVQEAVLDAAE